LSVFAHNSQYFQKHTNRTLGGGVNISVRFSKTSVQIAITDRQCFILG